MRNWAFLGGTCGVVDVWVVSATLAVIKVFVLTREIVACAAVAKGNFEIAMLVFLSLFCSFEFVSFLLRDCGKPTLE